MATAVTDNSIILKLHEKIPSNFFLFNQSWECQTVREVHAACATSWGWVICLGLVSVWCGKFWKILWVLWSKMRIEDILPDFYWIFPGEVSSDSPPKL